MRQRQRLELIKDYKFVINYHPGKANVVADALCRKNHGSIATLQAVQKSLLIENQKLVYDCTLR